MNYVTEAWEELRLILSIRAVDLAISLAPKAHPDSRIYIAHLMAAVKALT